MKTLHQRALCLTIVLSTVMSGITSQYHSQPHKALAHSLAQQHKPVLTVVTHSEALGESYPSDLAEQSTITATSTFTIHLPWVARGPGVIYGRITLNGQPAPNEMVHLYASCITAGIGYNYAPSTQATTDAQGNYRFINLPSVPYSAGRSSCSGYRAYYGDGLPMSGFISDPIGPWIISHAGRIYALATRTLSPYTAGTSAELENFDIGELVPITNISETVTLPTTFKWLPRSNATSESYEVWLFDYYCQSSPCVVPFRSGKLGYVDHFVLDSLPNGYSKNIPYDWFIRAELPTGVIAFSPYLQVAFK